MNLADYRTITNDFRDVRLLSLRSCRLAAEFQFRDDGGPYMVAQAGYDPDDLTMNPDEFVLSKSGQWISTGLFIQLPVELRRREYMFCTAAEVMGTIDKLPRKALVQRSLEVKPVAPATPEVEEYNAAFNQVRQEAFGTKPAPPAHA